MAVKYQYEVNTYRLGNGYSRIVRLTEEELIGLDASYIDVKGRISAGIIGCIGGGIVDEDKDLQLVEGAVVAMKLTAGIELIPIANCIVMLPKHREVEMRMINEH